MHACILFKWHLARIWAEVSANFLAKNTFELPPWFSSFLLADMDCPEAMVLMAMPSVMMMTERYLSAVYRLCRISIPRTMLAISEPCRSSLCSNWWS